MFPRLRRHLRWASCIIGMPVVFWLAFVSAVKWWPYPPGVDRPPLSGTFLFDRTGKPLAAFASIDGQWHLPLSREQVSPHLLRAIVAVEDSRFFEHHGVDWRSMAGALWQDARHLGIRRGGSTLTMQLQRLRDPKPRTWFNKLEQTVRAEQLERRGSKDAILVEYLNRAPFGGNLVGAGAASWRYFGRPCRDLSIGEAALLAGLPQSPNRLRPDRHPVSARARRAHVLDRMLACGMIDARQLAEASAEPIGARWLPLPQDAIPGAEPALEAIAGLHPGRTVRTTLDHDAEQCVAQMSTDYLASLRASNVSALAVVVLDTPGGQCLADVSCDSKQTNRTDLSRRPRSTGSTLKPFIYAAAFDAGICGPKSTLFDGSSAWVGYAPGNFDRTFRGPMPAADALAESRNIPALVLLGRIGVERMVGILESFGFATLSRAKRPYGLSLAIGGAESTPVELAEAYAALGRAGVWKRAAFVEGQAMPERRVMRPGPCRQVLMALSETARTESVSADAAALGVAWKTGTSSGHHDAWCAAITPRRTVVVWLGNPAGQASAALVGQEAAAPLALRVISALDPGGPGWEKVPEPEVAPSAPIPLMSHPSLAILSPAPAQRIILNPDQLPDRQQLLLSTNGEEGVWWFVDGTAAGRDRREWWSPTVGTHRIQVIDASGRAAAVIVHVTSAGGG